MRVLCGVALGMMGVASVLAATAESGTVVVAEPNVVAIPAEAQGLFDEALQALQAGQTEQANLSFKELVARYPTFSSPLINLGIMEQKANRHEAAIGYFKRALQLDATSVLANTNLGMSYRQLGQFKAAEAAYLAAIAADPAYARVHLNLGVLYDMYLQQPQQAIQEYETYQSLQSSPDAKVDKWLKDVKGRLNLMAAKTEAMEVRP